MNKDKTIRHWCIVVDNKPITCKDCPYHTGTLKETDNPNVFDMADSCNLTYLDINLDSMSDNCPIIENPALVKEFQDDDKYTNLVIDEIKEEV